MYIILLLTLARPQSLVLLNDQNFKQATNIGPGEYLESHWFIKFYAPWCGHCQAMKEDWIKLASHLANDTRVKVGQVDCTISKQLCSQHEIKSYPTLKYFSSNLRGALAYKDKREFQSMLQFVHTQMAVAMEL